LTSIFTIFPQMEQKSWRPALNFGRSLEAMKRVMITWRGGVFPKPLLDTWIAKNGLYWAWSIEYPIRRICTLVRPVNSGGHILNIAIESSSRHALGYTERRRRLCI
jgi:hypothetical protein